MRITDQEKAIALGALDTAIEAGASAAKVYLYKNTMSSCAVLDGEFDKLTHCSDRSLYFHIFADGRYGTFSTNRFDPDEIRSLLRKGVETVRMLAPDEARSLPDKSLYWKGESTGLEMELDDPDFESVRPERKMDIAMKCAEGIRKNVISSEIEFSDQQEASFTADSQGFQGLSYETTYAISSEITIKGKGAQRASGNWWDASPRLDGLRYADCASIALERAEMNLNPRKIRSGRYDIVLENTVASRVVAPIISGLMGLSIQQENSFLKDSLGKRIFPEWMNLSDNPHVKGAAGSRLFDSEGVATSPLEIIREGVVNMYFINSYASRKMGMPQTIESPSRPEVLAFDRTACNGAICTNGETSLSLPTILAKVGRGILVTGFNGGNTNPVTGDFSFGIEGFLFDKGVIVHPVSGMLATGNIIELWNRSLIAGNDPLGGTRWRIPSLAFADIDISGADFD